MPVVLDTAADGWERHFEFVEQSGHDTGNEELEDYRPAQVQASEGGVRLALSRQGARYVSGKIRSRLSLAELAPHGGSLDVWARGATVSRADGSSGRAAKGLWPAVWLLGKGAPWPVCGEIDLYESMNFDGGAAAYSGFSTLHFGPRSNADARWPGHWGLGVGEHFAWQDGSNHVRFEWSPLGPGNWRLTQQVNGQTIWSCTTSRADLFSGFEKGKAFQGAAASEFAPGAPGDPALVLGRAFDEPSRGMHLIVNLAFGGSPFYQGVDWCVRDGAFHVERVLVTAA